MVDEICSGYTVTAVCPIVVRNECGGEGFMSEVLDDEVKDTRTYEEIVELSLIHI